MTSGTCSGELGLDSACVLNLVAAHESPGSLSMILIDIKHPGTGNPPPASLQKMSLASLRCARCGRDHAAGHSPGSTATLMEQHMALVRDAIDRGIAARIGQAGKDDARVGLVRVQEHASAMLCLSGRA